MIHINFNKITIYFIFTVIFIFCSENGYANNTSYIALSNYIARKTQLGMVANNIANSNTLGYEADEVIFKNIDLNQKSKRSNSFVYAEGTYKSEYKGSLKTTNRPLDIAIAGDGFFKILTPRGDRYTLNGTIFISTDSVLVNAEGLPFANRDNQPIILPQDFHDVQIMQDGTINVDDEEIDIIGVFSFNDLKNINFIREANNLYKSPVRDIVLDDHTIISGALRSSNVNSARAMIDMVELQRSAGMTNNLMSSIADLEKSVISKVAK